MTSILNAERKEKQELSGESPDDGRRPECRRPWRRTVDVLAMTAWLALVVGYVEGAYWWISSNVFGNVTYLHPGYLWMAPLAMLTMLAVPGLVLAAVAWRTDHDDVAAFGLTGLSFVCWLDLLVFVPGLQLWAWVLAALGLSAATGRFFERRQHACLRFARRSALWLMAPLVILPPVQHYAAGQREANRIASLPDAPNDRPNILLIVLDTVRADALSVYGADPAATPNLARLAESGVVFEQAWVNAPWTLPSTASMFTGRLPHELSADWSSPLDDERATLAETLSERGWLTGGFVGNTRYCSRETGLARGFTHYEDYQLSWGNLAMCNGLGRVGLCGKVAIRCGLLDRTGRKRCGEVSGGLLRWLESREGRPFFAFLNYSDAHDPYLAPPPFRMHRPDDFAEKRLLRQWWWTEKEHLPGEHLALLKGAYADCVRALDHEIGRLLNQLADRGLLDNTMIVVTADHGEHFGEHNLFLHGNSLYEPLVHVPLIVAWPGKIPGGLRVDAPVALNGLPNTVLESIGEAKTFPGGSWAPRWSDGGGSTDPGELVIAELASPPTNPPCHGRSPVFRYGPMLSLREGSLKYIRAGRSAEELYDLAGDPREERNLIHDPRYAGEIERMRDYFRRIQDQEEVE